LKTWLESFPTSSKVCRTKVNAHGFDFHYGCCWLIGLGACVIVKQTKNQVCKVLKSFMHREYWQN
jgi:hypothetical protein